MLEAIETIEKRWAYGLIRRYGQEAEEKVRINIFKRELRRLRAGVARQREMRKKE